MASKTKKKPAPKAPFKAKVTSTVAPEQSRRVRQSPYKSGRLQKRIKHPVPIPSAWKITRQAAAILWRHKQLFGLIVVLYGALNIILVQGFATTDVTTLKAETSQLIGGQVGNVVGSASAFAQLLGSIGSGSSATAGAYQIFLFLVISLALIWSLRQVVAGAHVRVRDAYYRGMYPLIPFILVLLVIGLETLPLIAGVTLYEIVVSNGIAVNGIETLLWGMLAGLLALLSLYLITSSLFGLYIVTLPDMTPLKALRSARELVRYRRWTVLRKVLFLPVLLLVAAAIIMLPAILWLAPIASWIFFIVTMFALAAIHAYMYTLYRELLNE